MQCYKCKKEKDISEFYRDRSRPKGISALCKECTKKRDVERKDYLKEYHKKNQPKYKKLSKDFIYSLKYPCVNCGESDPVCIDFHHKDPKEKDFNLGRAIGWGRDKIKKEVDKCVCLCSNCHRKLHAGQPIKTA